MGKYDIVLQEMEVAIMETALLVVSIFLIAIVLLQSNKASDAGQIISGGNEALFTH